MGLRQVAYQLDAPQRFEPQVLFFFEAPQNLSLHLPKAEWAKHQFALSAKRGMSREGANSIPRGQACNSGTPARNAGGVPELHVAKPASTISGLGAGARKVFRRLQIGHAQALTTQRMSNMEPQLSFEELTKVWLQACPVQLNRIIKGLRANEWQRSVRGSLSFLFSVSTIKLSMMRVFAQRKHISVLERMLEPVLKTVVLPEMLPLPFALKRRPPK